MAQLLRVCLPQRRNAVRLGSSRRPGRGLRVRGAPFSAPSRLTGALLDRLTHRVHILKMNGESYRLKQSRQAVTTRSATDSPDAWTPPTSLPLRAPDDTHRANGGHFRWPLSRTFSLTIDSLTPTGHRHRGDVAVCPAVAAKGHG